jgi:hypothetical protein
MSVLATADLLKLVCSFLDPLSIHMLAKSHKIADIKTIWDNKRKQLRVSPERMIQLFSTCYSCYAPNSVIRKHGRQWLCIHKCKEIQLRDICNKPNCECKSSHDPKKYLVALLKCALNRAERFGTKEISFTFCYTDYGWTHFGAQHPYQHLTVQIGNSMACDPIIIGCFTSHARAELLEGALLSLKFETFENWSGELDKDLDLVSSFQGHMVIRFIGN